MVFRRTAENRPTPEAAEFVRFCYRRRPVGWPELYDEMRAVAMRRLFRGWDTTELARHGIGFSLEETPVLAELVERRECVCHHCSFPSRRKSHVRDRPSSRLTVGSYPSRSLAALTSAHESRRSPGRGGR